MYYAFTRYNEIHSHRFSHSYFLSVDEISGNLGLSILSGINLKFKRVLNSQILVKFDERKWAETKSIHNELKKNSLKMCKVHTSTMW